MRQSYRNMQTKHLFCLFLLFSSITLNSSYKILIIFPSPSYSHQLAPHAIARGLAEHGHHVTIISPIQGPQSPNIRQVNVDFLYKLWEKLNFSDGMGFFEFMALISKLTPIIMDQLLTYPEVQTILEKENGEEFDAILVENLGYVALNGLADYFNATLIGMTTMPTPPTMLQALGNTAHPILHPSNLLTIPNNPNLLDRIKATYLYLIFYIWMNYHYLPESDWVLKKHFDTKLSSHDLLKRVDLAIEGLSPVLGNTRPLLPNTVQIGMMHIQPPKELPADLKNYLDKSKNGVIYISFGSNVKSSSLSPGTRQILLETMTRLNHDILWKFEDDTLENLPKNVKIQKWLPQQDLLAHKNVKAFVTQGGLQSMEEAVSREVPLIVIPFFADQEHNANKIADLGFGVSVQFSDLTTEALLKAINEVVDDPKYKNKVTLLNQQIKDTPMPPIKTAVWWIEYAIRNRGAEHLKYKGANMSFIEYFLIDVVLVHIIAVFLLAFLITKAIKFCLGFLKPAKTVKKDVKKNKKLN